MKLKIQWSIFMLAAGFGIPAASQTTQVQVTVTNTGPTGGAWIMRPWLGLHDGNFQTFTVGQPAPSGVQHIAEDGVTGDLANTLPPSNACSGVTTVYNASLPCQYTVFNNYGNHGQQATLGNPTPPGAKLSKTFTVNPNDPNAQFMSYVVMIIPSNDAFFGSDTAHPIQLFKNGVFNGGNGPITIPVKFSDILDAGTEVNTGSAADTAFLGQAVPGTGTHPDSNAVIHTHDPFVSSIVNGSNMFGGMLNTFPMMNFQGQVALITIQEVKQIQFTITDTAPAGGPWIMRPWVGVHDGKFPTFTVGQPAPSGVQHIAEDGVTGDPANTLPPSNACTGVPSVYNASLPCQYSVFNEYPNRGNQASLGNPTPPGGTLSWTTSVSPADLNNQYLSYMVMIVPSNDAFFGSDTAHPIQLFKNGVFNGGNGPITIAVRGSDILDSGTEVNTESAADTAFLGQSVPGTGTHPDTVAVIHTHDAFGASILSGHNMFGGMLNSFPMMNYQGQIALVTIQEVTPVISSVVNAASGQAGSVAPGELVTMLGHALGPDSLAAAVPTAGKFPTTVGNTSVTVNGIPAPMLYSSATQTSFQIPYGVSGAATANIVTTNGSQSPLMIQVPVAASAPGIFTYDFSGKGEVVAYNQDNTVNSSANPAAKGTSILFFATGEGLVTPQGEDGTIQSFFPREPVLPVMVNGVTSTVMYAGTLPGEVAGVMEIEASIPSSTPTGAATVSLQVGTAITSVTTTIYVK
jgi:uncharacterized protein (TIGR03437 family)